MYIITDYTMVYNPRLGYFIIDHYDYDKSHTNLCPICGDSLTYRDSRPRIYRRYNGQKEHILIRRMRCSRCRCLHNEIPDCIVPHKHYASEIIENVLDQVSTPDNKTTEDNPCEQTMNRWKAWWLANHSQCIGILNSLFVQFTELFDPWPSVMVWMENLHKEGCGWFPLIYRLIVNSNHRLICT